MNKYTNSKPGKMKMNSTGKDRFSIAYFVKKCKKYFLKRNKFP